MVTDHLAEVVREVQQLPRGIHVEAERAGRVLNGSERATGVVVFAGLATRQIDALHSVDGVARVGERLPFRVRHRGDAAHQVMGETRHAADGIGDSGEVPTRVVAETDRVRPGVRDGHHLAERVVAEVRGPTVGVRRGDQVVLRIVAVARASPDRAEDVRDVVARVVAQLLIIARGQLDMRPVPARIVAVEGIAPFRIGEAGEIARKIKGARPMVAQGIVVLGGLPGAGAEHEPAIRPLIVIPRDGRPGVVAPHAAKRINHFAQNVGQVGEVGRRAAANLPRAARRGIRGHVADGVVGVADEITRHVDVSREVAHRVVLVGGVAPEGIHHLRDQPAGMVVQRAHAPGGIGNRAQPRRIVTERDGQPVAILDAREAPARVEVLRLLRGFEQQGVSAGVRVLAQLVVIPQRRIVGAVAPADEMIQLRAAAPHVHAIGVLDEKNVVVVRPTPAKRRGDAAVRAVGEAKLHRGPQTVVGEDQIANEEVIVAHVHLPHGQARGATAAIPVALVAARCRVLLAATVLVPMQMMAAANLLHLRLLQDLVALQARHAFLLHKGSAIPQHMEAIRRRVGGAPVRVDVVDARAAHVRDHEVMAIAQMRDERLRRSLKLHTVQPRADSLDALGAHGAAHRLKSHALPVHRQQPRQLRGRQRDALQAAPLAHRLGPAILRPGIRLRAIEIHLALEMLHPPDALLERGPILRLTRDLAEQRLRALQIAQPVLERRDAALGLMRLGRATMSAHHLVIFGQRHLRRGDVAEALGVMAPGIRTQRVRRELPSQLLELSHGFSVSTVMPVVLRGLKPALRLHRGIRGAGHKRDREQQKNSKSQTLERGKDAVHGRPFLIDERVGKNYSSCSGLSQAADWERSGLADITHAVAQGGNQRRRGLASRRGSLTASFPGALPKTIRRHSRFTICATGVRHF